MHSRMTFFLGPEAPAGSEAQAGQPSACRAPGVDVHATRCQSHDPVLAEAARGLVGCGGPPSRRRAGGSPDGPACFCQYTESTPEESWLQGVSYSNTTRCVPPALVWNEPSMTFVPAAACVSGCAVVCTPFTAGFEAPIGSRAPAAAVPAANRSCARRDREDPRASFRGIGRHRRRRPARSNLLGPCVNFDAPDPRNSWRTEAPAPPRPLPRPGRGPGGGHRRGHGHPV